MRAQSSSAGAGYVACTRISSFSLPRGPISASYGCNCFKGLPKPEMAAPASVAQQHARPGRLCHWRECRPGVRLACDARHCGRRPFLHDDLDVVTLDRGLVEAPPLELWPTVVPRARLPWDVKTQLVQPLTESSVHDDAHGA